MVQRSPTYIFALSSWLPSGAAHRLIQTKNALSSLFLYHRGRRKPRGTKDAILK
jgi:hypothetical protein